MAVGKGHGVGRRLPWSFADGCALPTAQPLAKNAFAHGFFFPGPSAKKSLPMASLGHR
jgi:hypothetical protein